MGKDQRKPISKPNKGNKIRVLNSERLKNLHLHIVHLRTIIVELVFGTYATDALIFGIREVYIWYSLYYKVVEQYRGLFIQSEFSNFSNILDHHISFDIFSSVVNEETLLVFKNNSLNTLFKSRNRVLKQSLKPTWALRIVLSHFLSRYRRTSRYYTLHHKPLIGFSF